MPSAPNRNKRIFSRRVEVSGWVNKPIIQNARAANVQRRVTPVSGLIHNLSLIHIWNELTDIQNPEAFCVTLVKNLCLDFLRSPRANRRDADVTEAVTLSTASSPDEELERQDKVQQIRHLIDRLPENQRQVLRLRGIEDCSMDEIEQITGLSAVNIRVLLSRARKIIREQLEKYYTCLLYTS